MLADPETKTDFDALWDYGDPAGTEAKFREAQAAVEAEGDAGRVAELLTQIARTHSLRRQFEEAHRLLDEAERSPDAISERAQVRILLERGRTLNSSKRPEEARLVFVRAWDLANSIGEDGLAVDAAHMIAIVLAGEDALKWNLVALALATTSAQPAARRWRKSLHNNVGWTYFEMGKPEMALPHFERCRDCAAEYADANAETIARWSIGKTLRGLGRIAEAIEIQEVLLEESAKTGRDPGYQSEEMAECLYSLGRIEDAKPYFAAAYESLSKDDWLVDRESDRLQRLKDLSS